MKKTTAHKQKRYTADPMAMFRVIRLTKTYAEHEVVKLSLPSRLAFEAIKSGGGVLDHFNELAVCINSAKVRSEAIDPLCAATCRAAQDAMTRTRNRYLSTGKFGFDGPAMQQIPDALDLHEEILRGSSPGLMTAALMEQYRRIDRDKNRSMA